MQWGLALLVPSTLMIPLSSLPPTGAVVASQAIFYLSLAAKSVAGMNAFTSSSGSAGMTFDRYTSSSNGPAVQCTAVHSCCNCAAIVLSNGTNMCCCTCAQLCW